MRGPRRRLGRRHRNGSQGRIVQLADFQSLRHGELDGQKTERVEAVDQAFRGAGFDAAISTQILQDMWQKWVQLASLGAITCLLRGNIGEIVAVRGGAELSLTALSECVAIAGAFNRQARIVRGPLTSATAALRPT